MTKKRKYTPRPTSREVNVYEGPTINRTPTKKNSLGDSGLIYDDDGITPFTGYKRVPATGWGGAKTSVLTWVQDGEITPPSFTTATDGTPFSMGGWDSYKKFWKPVVEVGKFTIDRYKDYHELRHKATKWLADQAVNLPTLGDRITPSDVPGQTIYQKKQEEKEYLDIQSRYKIPSSVQASDAIRLDNVEK